MTLSVEQPEKAHKPISQNDSLIRSSKNSNPEPSSFHSEKPNSEIMLADRGSSQSSHNNYQPSNVKESPPYFPTLKEQDNHELNLPQFSSIEPVDDAKDSRIGQPRQSNVQRFSIQPDQPDKKSSHIRQSSSKTKINPNDETKRQSIHSNHPDRKSKKSNSSNGEMAEKRPHILNNRLEHNNENKRRPMIPDQDMKELEMNGSVDTIYKVHTPTRIKRSSNQPERDHFGPNPEFYKRPLKKGEILVPELDKLQEMKPENPKKKKKKANEPLSWQEMLRNDDPPKLKSKKSKKTLKSQKSRKSKPKSKKAPSSKKKKLKKTPSRNSILENIDNLSKKLEEQHNEDSQKSQNPDKLREKSKSKFSRRPSKKSLNAIPKPERRKSKLSSKKSRSKSKRIPPNDHHTESNYTPDQSFTEYPVNPKEKLKNSRINKKLQKILSGSAKQSASEPQFESDDRISDIVSSQFNPYEGKATNDDDEYELKRYETLQPMKSKGHSMVPPLNLHPSKSTNKLSQEKSKPKKKRVKHRVRRAHEPKPEKEMEIIQSESSKFQSYRTTKSAKEREHILEEILRLKEELKTSNRLREQEQNPPLSATENQIQPNREPQSAAESKQAEETKREERDKQREKLLNRIKELEEQTKQLKNLENQKNQVESPTPTTDEKLTSKPSPKKRRKKKPKSKRKKHRSEIGSSHAEDDMESYASRYQEQTPSHIKKEKNYIPFSQKKTPSSKYKSGLYSATKDKDKDRKPKKKKRKKDKNDKRSVYSTVSPQKAKKRDRYDPEGESLNGITPANRVKDDRNNLDTFRISKDSDEISNYERTLKDENYNHEPNKKRRGSTNSKEDRIKELERQLEEMKRQNQQLPQQPSANEDEKEQKMDEVLDFSKPEETVQFQNNTIQKSVSVSPSGESGRKEPMVKTPQKKDAQNKVKKRFRNLVKKAVAQTPNKPKKSINEGDNLSKEPTEKAGKPKEQGKSLVENSTEKEEAQKKHPPTTDANAPQTKKDSQQLEEKVDEPKLEAETETKTVKTDKNKPHSPAENNIQSHETKPKSPTNQTNQEPEGDEK